MKNKFCLLLALLVIINTASAQEDTLDIAIDTTYMSRYIDKGFDGFENNHSGMIYSIDTDFFNTGFGFNVNWIRANSSGFENAEKIEYSFYYGNSLFEESTLLTEYEFAYIYNSLPDNPRKACNSHELNMSLCWPKIQLAGFTPSYTAVVEWPAESNGENLHEGGWMHIFGIERDISPILFDKPQEPLIFSTFLTYNGSLGPRDVDHDFSHILFGLTTEYRINENITFIPGLHYQLSFDDSVNKNDEYFFTLGFAYEF